MLSISIDGDFKNNISLLRSKDMILLSGTVYTARDAAHKEISELIRNKKELPFDLSGSVIYYTGPSAAPPGMPVGSCGPTTSGRMDAYAPALYDMGLAATIGKGKRSQEVREAIVRNGGIYLCALGGCGALAAQCVVSCETVAFGNLGCESIKRLILKDFIVAVGIDIHGGSIYE